MQKSKSGLLVGFAGTNGKTMSALLLRHVLQKAGRAAIYFEGCRDLSRLPFYLSRKYWRDKIIIQEITHEGILKGVYKRMPLMLGVTTNVYLSPGSNNSGKPSLPEKYFLKNLDPRGFALVNADDPLCLEAADATSAQVVTYALNYPNAMIIAEDYRPRPFGCSFRITIKNDLSCLGGWIYPPQSFTVSLPLPGKAGVYTGLAAAACSLVLGQSIDDIFRGFKTFPGVKRRFELIRHNGVTVIDDTVPNQPALKAFFEGLSALSFKKTFIIFYLEKDKIDKDRKIALELLEQEKSIPIGEIFLTASRSDASGQAGAREERAFKEIWHAGGGIARLSFFQSLEDTVEEAVLSLREGDLLLLLGGAGMNRAAALVSKMLEAPRGILNEGIVIPDEITVPGRFLNPS